MPKTFDLKGRPRRPDAPPGCTCVFCGSPIVDRNAERAFELHIGGTHLWHCFNCFIDLYYEVEPTSHNPAWVDLKRYFDVDYAGALKSPQFTLEAQQRAREYIDDLLKRWDRESSIQAENRQWDTYNLRTQYWTIFESKGLLAYKEARKRGERPSPPPLVDFRQELPRGVLIAT